MKKIPGIIFFSTRNTTGAEISTSTGDTPDVVMEILKPDRVFVVIEAKMFENLPQTKLDK